jgi:hypothetical protein
MSMFECVRFAAFICGVESLIVVFNGQLSLHFLDCCWFYVTANCGSCDRESCHALAQAILAVLLLK